MSQELIPLCFLYPGLFWALPKKTESGHSTLSLLEDLTERIKSYALSSDAEPLKDNTHRDCIAMLDTFWARGQCRNRLRRKHDYLIQVFFIDYGVSRTIGMEKILEMPEYFLSYKPLAIRYGVYGIKASQKYGDSSLLKEKWGKKADLKFGISIASHPVIQIEVQGYVGNIPFVSGSYKDSEGASIALDSHLIESGLAEEYIGLPLLESRDGGSQVSLPTQEESSVQSKLTAFSTTSQRSAFAILHSNFHPQAFIQGENIPPMSLTTQCFSSTFIQQLASLSFPGPTIVQSYAWPIILSGRDLLAISPTQSGKTLAYLLPLLHRLLTDNEEYKPLHSQEGPYLIVFCCSSQEADYVHMVCRKVVSWKDPGKVNLCAVAYQGFEASAVDCLSSGAEILVCTPCSAMRLLKSNILSLSRLCHLVFDSASLVKMYEEEVKLFMRQYATLLQENRKNQHSIPPQVLIFSTAYSDAILSLMRAYTKSRITLITCPIEACVFQQVTQCLVNCSQQEKCERVADCLESNSYRTAICLSNVSTLAELSLVLGNHGYRFHVLNQNIESSKEAMQLLDDWESNQDPDQQKGDIFILFDQAIERFAINLSYVQIATLIHFEFPSNGNTKKIFRGRSHLFTESFNLGLGSTCQSIILLTKDLGNKVTFLFSLHTRLGNKVPGEVTNQLLQIRENKKLSRRSDLCFYYKSFGECPHLSSCRFLHTISSAGPINKSLSSLSESELIPYPDTPRSGSIRVLVSHVSNPSQIWVRILEHYPFKLGEATCPAFNASQALTISREIQTFAAQWNAKDRMCVPKLDRYYALYDAVDNIFYRVQTLKFSRALDQLIFFHTEQVEVRCIDSGELKVAFANQLIPLPDHLYQVPRQVVEAVCCRIKPLDKDRDWSSHACEFAERCLKGKHFVGRIALNFQGLLFLDILENFHSFESLNLTGSTLSYNQELINKGFVISNLTHLTKLGIEQMKDQSINVEYESLVLNSDIEVIISAIDTPQLFYAQKCSNRSKLEELNDAINRHNLPSFNPYHLEAGQYCAARLSVDSKLYRGKVVAISPDFLYEIYFIDYGDVEWVKKQEVYPLSDDYLGYMSAQAVPCLLRGFEGDEAEYSDLTSAGDTLWDLTRERTVLLAVESSISENELHTGIHMYSVDLYGQDSSVLEVLMKGIGLTPKPVATDSPLSQLRESCREVLSESEGSLEELNEALLRCDEVEFEVKDWNVIGNCVAKCHTTSHHVPILLKSIFDRVNRENRGNQIRICFSKLLPTLFSLELTQEAKLVIFQILTLVEKRDTFSSQVLSPSLIGWLLTLFRDLSSLNTQASIVLFLNNISQHTESAARMVLESGVLQDWTYYNIPFVFIELLVSLSGHTNLRNNIVELAHMEFLFQLLSYISGCEFTQENSTNAYSIFRLLSLLSRNNTTVKQIISEKLGLLQNLVQIYKDEKIAKKFVELRLFSISRSSTPRKRPSSKCSLFKMPLPTPPPNKTRHFLFPLWSQTKTRIKISCKTENAIAADIFFTAESKQLDIFIRTKSKLLSNSFPLFAQVEKDITRYLYGTEVLFVLIKSEKGVWPYLTSTFEQQKQLRISVDFDRFQMLINSSSDEEMCSKTYVRMRESSSEESLSNSEKIQLSDEDSDN